MKKGGIGGGNTITGLIYEGEVDLSTYLAKQKDYDIDGTNVLYKGKVIAYILSTSFITFLKKITLIGNN